MVQCYQPRCHGRHYVFPGGQHATYTWAHSSSCSQCKCIGYLCMDNCTLRKAIKTRGQLSRHNYKQHSSSSSGMNYGSDPPINFGDNMDNVSTAEIAPMIVLPTIALETFLAKSRNEGMVMAIRTLVCGACFRTRRLPPAVIQSIPLKDTYFVLLLARIVFSIGTVHNALLSTLLSVFVISRPSTRPSALPITKAQLSSVITNKSNQMSIAASLPTPRPTEIGARHAFVDLVEVIGHALGMQPPNTVVNDKYQRLVHSVQGQKCLQEAQAHYDESRVTSLQRLVCCLTFWFDGWDPNSSMTKANKTPIWSGTATLIFTSLDGQVMFATTQLVASGPGKADHTEVVQCLLDSMLSMQQLCSTRSVWVRMLLASAFVYPCVLAITCDQPERRSINGLLAGNSKLHACFGISCNTTLLEKPLEACDVCVAQLNRYTAANNFEIPCLSTCASCLHWTLPTQPGVDLSFRYTAPIDNNFPPDAVAGRYLNSHAGMITNTILKEAWNEAYDNWVIDKAWTAKQVIAYFKVLTINDSTTSKFIEQGRRCQLAMLLNTDAHTIPNEDVHRALQESMAKNPSRYEKPMPPPMWNFAELDTLPEAVMHLAMGVVKSVSKFVHNWASARNKSPYLSERMNFCINMHRKYCRIGWSPVATYSMLGKFPGWVADTFRTWWIWMPWLYSALDNATFEYTPYVLPTQHPLQWNGMVCTKFLKSRGHPGYAKLKAEQSKAQVRAMHRLPSWPMEDVVPVACSVSGRDLQDLIWHCHSLFKELFAEPNSHLQRNAADCHVKLLLSIVTKLDRLLHADDSLPNLYEVKYNFISLPRAVRLLATFGSARNIQEGGVDGEGIVKQLRPLTPRGLKQHFAKNLIVANYREQQLAKLCQDVSIELAATPDNNQAQFAQLHNTIYEVEQELTTGDDVVLSGDDLCDEDDINLWDQFEELSVDDDANEEVVVATSNNAVAHVLDKQLFLRYKSVSQLQEYHSLGLPLSFVVADLNGNITIGFVVGNYQTGHLLPLRIGAVAVNSVVGFPYFHTSIEVDVDEVTVLYSPNACNVCTQHFSVVNYGHLLPCLAAIDANNVAHTVPYAIVTTNANHLNASFQFV